MKLVTINILELLESYGEEKLNKLLKDFECKKDSSIEKFLKNNATNFAKQKLSSTFLIMDENFHIYGMFALTHKALYIKSNDLSKTLKNKILKYSSSTYKDALLVSSFLIAQLARNLKYKKDKIVTGKMILESAINHIIMARKIISGSLLYVDVKNKKKLLDFYTTNGFIQFDKRYSEKDKIEYIQMMKFV